MVLSDTHNNNLSLSGKNKPFQRIDVDGVRSPQGITSLPVSLIASAASSFDTRPISNIVVRVSPSDNGAQLGNP